MSYNNMKHPVLVSNHLELHEKMLKAFGESIEKTKKRLHEAELTLNLKPAANEEAELLQWKNKVDKLISTRDELPFPSYYQIKKAAEIRELKKIEKRKSEKETKKALEEKLRMIQKKPPPKLVEDSVGKPNSLIHSKKVGEPIRTINNYKGCNSFYNGPRILVTRGPNPSFEDKKSDLPEWFGPQYYNNTDPSYLREKNDSHYQQIFKASSRNSAQEKKIKWLRRLEIKNKINPSASNELPVLQDEFSLSGSFSFPTRINTTAGPEAQSRNVFTASQSSNSVSNYERGITIRCPPTPLLPTSYGDHNNLINKLFKSDQTTKNHSKTTDYTMNALSFQNTIPPLRHSQKSEFQSIQPSELSLTSSTTFDETDEIESSMGENRTNDFDPISSAADITSNNAELDDIPGNSHLTKVHFAIDRSGTEPFLPMPSHLPPMISNDQESTLTESQTSDYEWSRSYVKKTHQNYVRHDKHRWNSVGISDEIKKKKSHFDRLLIRPKDGSPANPVDEDIRTKHSESSTLNIDLKALDLDFHKEILKWNKEHEIYVSPMYRREVLRTRENRLNRGGDRVGDRGEDGRKVHEEAKQWMGPLESRRNLKGKQHYEEFKLDQSVGSNGSVGSDEKGGEEDIIRSPKVKPIDVIRSSSNNYNKSGSDPYNSEKSGSDPLTSSPVAKKSSSRVAMNHRNKYSAALVKNRDEWNGLLLENNPYSLNDDFLKHAVKELEKVGI